MRRSKAVVAAVAGAALFTLAACGGGGDEGPSGNASFSEGAAGGTGKDATAVGPAPEVEGAQTGGTITIKTPDPDDGPTSLDPAGLWSVTDNAIAQDLLFRSLTTFRRDATSGEYILVPDLATDLGRPSDDFKTWTFTLKDGIKWEDGSPVTAEQVAFGIKRSFDATNFPTGPGTSYSNPYFLGGDKYQGPYISGETFKGVTVQGNDIILKMGTPFPEMDYYAIFPAIGPVPLGDASKPPAYGLKPMSTGPYKIQKYVPNQELVLVKNDQWDPTTDPARHQYVDQWNFKFEQNNATVDETVISDNEEGQTLIDTQLLGTNYNKLLTAAPDRVIIGPQPCTGFAMPVYSKIKELEVRQALAFAYPYEDVWSAGGDIPGVTLANGVTDPSLGFGLLPPGMAGRQVVNPEIDGETIKYDPDHAKALLKKAGYDPGEYEISWVYDSSSPEGKAAMQQVKQGYEASGFKTKPYGYPGSLYDVWTDPENNIHKKLNLLGTAWCQDWPSGSTFLPVIVGSSPAPGPYNTGGFSEKDVDDRIAAIKLLPVDEQAAAWGELDKYVMETYQPVINRGYYQNIFAFGSKIGGFANDTSVGGAPNYRDIFVK